MDREKDSERQKERMRGKEREIERGRERENGWRVILNPKVKVQHKTCI